MDKSIWQKNNGHCHLSQHNNFNYIAVVTQTSFEGTDQFGDPSNHLPLEITNKTSIL